MSFGFTLSQFGMSTSSLAIMSAGGNPPPAAAPMLYGMNISPNQRIYNNLCAREYWRGDHIAADPYAAMAYPYVSAEGDFVTMPPGIATARLGLSNPGNGTDSWHRLKFAGGGDGSGMYLIQDGADIPVAATKTGPREWEFRMIMADSDPNSGTYLATNSTPATPVTDVDCREITGPGGAYVNPGTFWPAFIANEQPLGDYYRLMDYMGVNTPTYPSTMSMTWAQRPMSRRSLGYKSARIAHGTGSSRLIIQARPVIVTDAQAELLATMLPSSGWNGAAGNSCTFTLNAPSGAGSVTVVGRALTVTPAVGATTAAQIGAQIVANTTANAMFRVIAGTNEVTKAVGETGYSAALAAGTVTTPLATANLAGGFDGPQGGYWPDIVEMITLLGKPAWLNISFNGALTDFAASAAAYVKANVPATCWPCLFELGNEQAWNFSMGMMRWGYAIAVYNGRTGANTLEKTVKEYISRATTASIAIKAAAPGALTVLGAQSAGVSTTTAAYLALPGVNSTNIDFIATAPYFQPDGSKADNDDAGYYDSGYVSIAAKVANIAATDAALAGTGIVQIMYEGGQHDDNETLIGTALRRQRSPEMGVMMSYYFSEMARVNGVGTAPKRFTFYSSVNSIGTSSTGAWNLFEYQGQAPTPKSIAWQKARAGVFYPYFLYGQAPAVSGTRMATATLTATVPTAYNAIIVAYAWLRDGTPIPGETALTYLQTGADATKNIEFRATLTNSAGDTRVYTTNYATATAAYTKFVEIPFGTTSYQLPADFPGTGKIHCFGAGGRGVRSAGGTNLSHGGGGGAYAAINAYAGTALAAISCQMGDEGSGVDTWFGSSATVLAKAGGNATGTAGLMGVGGAAASCIGDVKYSGGTGGSGTASGAGGGGGGAAGPTGNGANGGNSSGNDASGGGGGGANGGTIGQAGQGLTSGGRGGSSRIGTLGGAGATGASTAAQAGTNGSGGGGGLRDGIKSGAANSKDPVFNLTAGGTAGPGSGSGAQGGSPGAGGLAGSATNGYGGATAVGNTASPAAGKGGIILEYVPVA